MEPKKLRNSAELYLKGFLIGCAETVPGVSGATIAMITGVYSSLIDSLSAIGSLRPEKTDFKFLTVLGAGTVTALLIFLNMMNFLLNSYTVSLYGFFFTVIFFSGLILVSKIDLKNRKKKLAVVLGLIVSITVSGLSSTALDHSLPVIFFSGFISITALVFPGISGSLILIMLGQYSFMVETVNNALNTMFNSLRTFDIKGFLSVPVELPVFLSGAVLGLGFSVYFVKNMFSYDRDLTISFLVSLVLGSSVAPLIRISENSSATGFAVFATSEFLLPAILGSIITLLLESKTNLISVDT